MPQKPPFDPSKPFEASGGAKPPFDPNKPFTQEQPSFQQPLSPMTTPSPGAAGGVQPTGSATPQASSPATAPAPFVPPGPMLDAAMTPPADPDYSKRGTQPPLPQAPLTGTEKGRADLFKIHAGIRDKDVATRDAYSEALKSYRAVRDAGRHADAEAMNRKLSDLSAASATYQSTAKETKAKVDAQIEELVSESIDKDHASLMMSDGSDADATKVRQRAEAIAAKYGVLGDQEITKSLQNKITDRVRVKAIEPRANALFEKKKEGVLGPVQKKLWDEFTTDDVEYANAETSIKNVQSTIKAESSKTLKQLNAELDTSTKDLTAKWAAQEAGFKQQAEALNEQVRTGAMTPEQANAAIGQLNAQYDQAATEVNASLKATRDQAIERLSQANAKYNRQFVEEQTSIIRGTEKRVKEASEKFLAEYEGSPEAARTRMELERAYSDAWDEAAKERSALKDAIAHTRYQAQRAGAGLIGAFMSRFTESTISGLGGAMKGIATTMGSDNMYVLGEEMERAFVLPEVKSKKFTDLLDSENFSQLSGQLLGGMAPSVIAGAGATLATGGAGAPVAAQLAAGALAGWGGETLSIVGQAKDDEFKRNGNMEKANDAAWKSFTSQVQLLPTYAFDGLPFIKGALNFIPTKLLRAGAGAGIEFGTEVIQEVPQGIAEKNIRDGFEPWENFGDVLADQYESGELKSLLITMAPIAVLGGGPQLLSTGHKAQLEAAAKSYAAKVNVSRVVGSAQAQWMDNMVQQRGGKFAEAVLSTMFTGGQINDAQYLKMQDGLKKNAAYRQEASNMNLPKEQHGAYVALLAQHDQLSAAAEAEQSTTGKAIMNKRAKEAQAAAVAISEGKGDFVTVRYPDGSTTAMSPGDANRLFNDPSFLKTAAVTGFGLEGMTLTGNGVESMRLVEDFQGRSMGELDRLKTAARERITGLKQQNAPDPKALEVERKKVEEEIATNPPDPAIVAAKGDPRAITLASLTARELEAKGVTEEESAVSMASQGMLVLPPGTTAITAPDGKVSIEVKEAKEGEVGPTKEGVMDDLIAQYNKIKNAPPVAPNPVGGGGDAVTSEAATTTNATNERNGKGRADAGSANEGVEKVGEQKAPTDTGAAPSVPPPAPKEQITELGNGVRLTTSTTQLTEQLTVFKGQRGKVGPDGKRITAHPNAKGVFSSASEKTAKSYAAEGETPARFPLPMGTTVETVEVSRNKQNPDQYRDQETDAINNSKAQVVKLITYDSGKGGKQVQYVIKDPALLGKASGDAKKSQRAQPRKLSQKEAEILGNKLAAAIGGTVQWDAKQEGKAYVKGDVVYLNPDKVAIDTPLHEIAGHILIGRLRGGNSRDRELYRKIINLAKEAPPALVEKITKFYPELTPGTERFYEEIFSTYLGLMQPNVMLAEEIIEAATADKGFMEKFFDLIRYVANRAGDLAGITRRGLMKERTLKGLAGALGKAAYSGRKITSATPAKARTAPVEQSKSLEVASSNRYTLAVFGTKGFQQLYGKTVKRASIEQAMNQQGVKEIEKDIIRDVMKFPRFSGDTIDFNDFSFHVGLRVTPLHQIESGSYASYGMERLGADKDAYGNAKTIIFNVPSIDHGVTGHFPSDFNKGGTKWVAKQIPGTETWIAVDEKATGLPAEQMQYFIGTAGPEADVKKWTESQTPKEGDSESINKGLFGHIRRWFGGEGKPYYMAELQSDFFQKVDLKEALLSKEAAQRIIAHEDVVEKEATRIIGDLNEKTSVPVIQGVDQDKWSDFGVKLESFGSGLTVYTGGDRAYLFGTVIETSPGTWRIKDPWSDKMWAEEFVNEWQAATVLQDLRNTLPGHISVFDDRLYNAAPLPLKKALDEIRPLNKGLAITADDHSFEARQVIAAAKTWEKRMLREAVKDAATQGASEILIPTPNTAALIEGYPNARRPRAGGGGAMPYTTDDGDTLAVSDTINLGDQEYRVVEVNGDEIIVVNQDALTHYSHSDAVQDHMEGMEVGYSLKRWAERNSKNKDRLTKTDLDGYSGDYDYAVEQVAEDMEDPPERAYEPQVIGTQDDTTYLVVDETKSLFGTGSMEKHVGLVGLADQVEQWIEDAKKTDPDEVWVKVLYKEGGGADLFGDGATYIAISQEALDRAGAEDPELAETAILKAILYAGPEAGANDKVSELDDEWNDEYEEWADKNSISLSNLEDKVLDMERDSIDGWGGEEFFGGYDWWDDGSGGYYVSYDGGGNVQTLSQPYAYAEAAAQKPKEEGAAEEVYDGQVDLSTFNSTQRTVLSKYIELAKIMRKERKHVELWTDPNGNPWLRSPLTQEDATNPVIAFSKDIEMPVIDDVGSETPVSNTPGFEWPQISDLKEEGSLGGSTGAKLYFDEKTGMRYAVKKGAVPGQSETENEANAIYAAAGIPVPLSAYYKNAGVLVTGFVRGQKLSQLRGDALAEAEEKVAEGFAMDALLANWDVIGLDRDNIVVTYGGHPVRVDNGGSIDFRAQGGLKEFGPTVRELDSMRTSDQGKAIFGKLTDQDVAKQIRLLLEKGNDILAAVKDRALRDGIMNRLIYMEAWAENVEKKNLTRKSPARDEALKIAKNRNSLGNPIALTQEKVDNFFRWFPENPNKWITDKNGNPKVLYHGTARDVRIFKPKQAKALFTSSSPGFAEQFARMSVGWMKRHMNEWMTPEQKLEALEAAEKYISGDEEVNPFTTVTNANEYAALNDAMAEDIANERAEFERSGRIGRLSEMAAIAILPNAFGQTIYPLYVSAKNTWNYHDDSHVKALIDVIYPLKSEEELAEMSSDDKATYYQSRNFSNEDFLTMQRGDWKLIETYPDQIRELGFDSFIVTEGGEDNIAVFDETQVKSVYGNNGNFSGTDPDIQHSKSIDHEVIASYLNEGDGLTGDALDVAVIMEEQEEEKKHAMKVAAGTLREHWVRGFEDATGIAKEKARNAGAHKAVRNRILQGGASAASRKKWEEFHAAIFQGLKPETEKLLNSVIQARRTIAIDTRRDAEGQPRPLHTKGLTKEKAEVFLEQLRNAQPDVMRDIDARADAYFNANRALLKMKLDEGRISQELHDKLASWDYARRSYLHHIEDAEASGGGSIYSSRAASTKDIRALGEGSEEALFNDFRYLLKAHTLSTYKTNFENATNKALGEFAQKDPNNGLLEMVKPVSYDQYGNPEYPAPKTGFEHIVYFDGGVRYEVQAPADFVVQWNEADPMIKPQLGNQIRMATGGSFKRMMLTGLNPAFIAANFFRDFAHVLTVTNAYSPHFPIAFAQLSADIATVTKDATTRGKLYQQYIADGGGMDFLTNQGRPLMRSGIGGDPTLGSKTLDALGYLNETSELIMRLALYKRLIDDGTKRFENTNGRKPNTPAEEKDIRLDAAAQARDQMDFSQGGSYAKAIDNFIPYTNAALQGTRVMFRYAKNNPALFSYKMVQLASVAMGIYAYAVASGGDDLDDIPEEVKSQNFIFFLPWYTTDSNGVKRRKYLKIAKSHEQAIVAAIFESMVDLVMRGKTPSTRIWEGLKTSLPGINPMNIPLIDALNAYFTGYDTFRDRQVSPKMNKVEPWMESKAGKTPEFLISIGKAVRDAEGIVDINEGDRGASPARMELAASRLAGQPEGNFYYSLFGKSYNLIAEGLGVNERRELDKTMGEHLSEITKPITKRLVGETYPSSKIDRLKEVEKKNMTSDMEQNETLRSMLTSRVGKSEKEKKEIDARATKYITSQPKADYKRLMDRYIDGKKNEGIDPYYIMLRNSTKDTRAMMLFQEGSTMTKEERKEMWMTATKVGGIVTEDVLKEYARLMKAQRDAAE